MRSGIGQWEQNSQIVHATAEDPLGPYTEQDTVAGVFAHEPCVTRDPRTGELLMVSVNYPVCLSPDSRRFCDAGANCCSVQMHCRWKGSTAIKRCSTAQGSAIVLRTAHAVRSDRVKSALIRARMLALIRSWLSFGLHQARQAHGLRLSAQYSVSLTQIWRAGLILPGQ